MPIYGVRVEQSRNTVPFSNRFYTVADSLSAALDNGAEFWGIIKPLFGNDVVNNNIHAWVTGASPNHFSNRPRSVAGELNIVSPFKLEIVARFLYGAEGSYSYYNDLRVSLDGSFMDGVNWALGYQEDLSEVALNLQTFIGADKMVLKNGDSLGTVAFSPEYHFHQLHKRWYNRSS